MLDVSTSTARLGSVVKQSKLSGQIRSAILASAKSRYAICKELDLDQAALSRFMSGTGGLSLEVLDRLVSALDLELVPRQTKRGRRK